MVTMVRPSFGSSFPFLVIKDLLSICLSIEKVFCFYSLFTVFVSEDMVNINGLFCCYSQKLQHVFTVDEIRPRPYDV